MFRIILVILSAGFMSLTHPCSQAADPFRPTITVTGTAEIQVAPDEVLLSISVESRDQELSNACEDNDRRIQQVIAQLKKSRVETPDIRTEVIKITPLFPERRPGQPLRKRQVQANQSVNEDPFGDRRPQGPAELMLPVPLGYLAVRELSVRIKQLDQFEKIYRELIQQGVNRVSGIQFQTSKLREYRDQVRLDAVRAAQEKAVAMANQLQARVAAVESVVEEGSPHRPRASNYLSREAAFGVDSSQSLAAGLMEITASVRVVFLLDQVEFAE